MENRVALTLRMVGGLTVPEIARAFLVQETAMGQRITRADLLRRLGRSQESYCAYDKAIELSGNTAESAYLIRRRNQLRC
jgi:RNA polymerase sigma-70 factor (ECF subfamily)